MVKIVTDYLEMSAQKYPDKVAFADEKREMTFKQLQKEAQQIAMELIEDKLYKQPVLIYLDKGVEVIAAFLGVTYSGNYYSPIDTGMPQERIDKIVNKLQPVAIITDEKHRDSAQEIIGNGKVIIYEDCLTKVIDLNEIERTTRKIIDTDILYVLFTSGSTGTPKGVIISHKSIVDFTEWAADELGFSEESIMGNQCPFYFSMSIYDVFETLRNGSTTYIIPQTYFSQPTKLMKYLDEKKVNTLVWVPSILMFISTLKALDRPHLSHLKGVFFGAEVFQTKHLNRWMKEYPEVRFVNIYGPTEITDTCSYYEVKKQFHDDEMLPIGVSCKNKECFLLDDDKLVTEVGEIGEICVRGTGVAYGYFNDEEKTNEVFVQNPLNTAYKEIIYRTGDLGRYNEDGDLVYVCRKDFQIKHKGHRIELGEIETIVSAIDEVEDNCCIYDEKNLRIVLFYTGEIGASEISGRISEKLPEYMVPAKKVHLDKMPKNLNGKTDRQKLREML